MRRRLVLMVALGVVWAIGCTPMDKVSTTSWLPRRHPFQGPIGPDVVQIRVALLEVRPGEADWKYVNDDLWQLADESLIDEDRRLVMDESGFRVAKVGTQPPAQLLAMLTSRRFNPTPRDLTFRTGDPKGLSAGPSLPRCRYRVDRDGEPLELDQVDCKLLVAASRGPNGRTMLRITPQVIHGDAMTVYRADAQAGTIVSVPERPTETYTQIGWDAELALNEYLIVGGNYQRTETLGHKFFVRPDEAQPVQRVLVIQMGAAPPEMPPATPAGGQPATTSRSAPLAYQTAWPAARGAAP
jgi:hypothetical protein